MWKLQSEGDTIHYLHYWDTNVQLPPQINAWQHGIFYMICIQWNKMETLALVAYPRVLECVMINNSWRVFSVEEQQLFRCFLFSHHMQLTKQHLMHSTDNPFCKRKLQHTTTCQQYQMTNNHSALVRPSQKTTSAYLSPQCICYSCNTRLDNTSFQTYINKDNANVVQSPHSS